MTGQAIQIGEYYQYVIAYSKLTFTDAGFAIK